MSYQNDRYYINNDVDMSHNQADRGLCQYVVVNDHFDMILCVVEKRRNPLGATGEAVRTNVRRLREAQNLGYAQLSRRLKTSGRAIPELGLRRIEDGERRVDADDLLALAAALNVSPTTLLMPKVVDADSPVETTGLPEGTTAERLWRWMTAATPLTGGTPSEFYGFISRSMPSWLGTELEVIECGTRPNRTYRVLGEQEWELGSAEHGND